MKSLFVNVTFMATILSFIAINSHAQNKNIATTPANPTASEKETIATTTPASSQDKKTEASEAVKNLMKFLGRWEADAVLTVEGKIYKVRYTINGRKTADGNGLELDEEFTHPELGTMKGSNLAGFDSYDSKIKWFSVDNMGTTHEHAGEWDTPNHLLIVHDGMRDGKKYEEKINFTFTVRDELNFSLVSTLDGIVTEMGNGVFRKKVVPVKK